MHGRARVIRVLRERLANRPDAAIEAVHVNGAPGLALRGPDGQVLGVLSFDLGGGIDRPAVADDVGRQARALEPIEPEGSSLFGSSRHRSVGRPVRAW